MIYQDAILCALMLSLLILIAHQAMGQDVPAFTVYLMWACVYQPIAAHVGVEWDAINTVLQVVAAAEAGWLAVRHSPRVRRATIAAVAICAVLVVAAPGVGAHLDSLTVRQLVTGAALASLSALVVLDRIGPLPCARWVRVHLILQAMWFGLRVASAISRSFVATMDEWLLARWLFIAFLSEIVALYWVEIGRDHGHQRA